MNSTAETSQATGVERIAAAFDAARAEGRAALMPYLMGGFPSGEVAAAVAAAYAEAGADLIEIGVPFSDPLADGPVIHDAATRALAAGADLDEALAEAARVAPAAAVVPMCYANMVLARGPERYAAELAAAGASGTIVPDLPLEEAGSIAGALEDAGLALVPLVAPTTPPDRRRAICERARGFVYLVSDTRVTGEREELPSELAELVAAVKEDSPVPVAVGFGIATPEQAAEVGRVADGVIIGSRLVRAVAEAADAASAARAVSGFVSDTHAALAAG